MLLVDSRWWMFTVQFFQHFCTLELLRASRTTDSISLLEYRNPPALPALACCLALILKSVWDFGINAISQQRRGALTRGGLPFGDSTAAPQLCFVDSREAGLHRPQSLQP